MDGVGQVDSQLQWPQNWHKTKTPRNDKIENEVNTAFQHRPHNLKDCDAPFWDALTYKEVDNNPRSTYIAPGVTWHPA
jgi:hypothetical protein